MSRFINLSYKESLLKSNTRNLNFLGKEIRHIVLDIDLTLIDTNSLLEPIPRPYLEEFLYYLFTNYDSVSIWTAAGKEWLNEVYNKILKNKLPSDMNFRHMLHVEKCIMLINYGGSYDYYKPLSYLYSIDDTMNKNNTLMVDDNPLSFHDNEINGYLIKSYNYDSDIEDNDDELMQLVIELQSINKGS